jgi:hypothetical protein
VGGTKKFDFAELYISDKKEALTCAEKRQELEEKLFFDEEK